MNSKTENIIAVSVVIPVYNSEKCLEPLLTKLKCVLEKSGKEYEIILINDGSTDKSWESIEKLSERFKIKGLNLKKNFGQDNAIMAGLTYSSGKLIIIMDDDLQHAPEDIPLLIEQIEKGHDVCYANFNLKKQSILKNAGSWFNGKIANIVINKPDHIYLSPFKVITRDVIREILKYDGPYPYVDGLLFSVTRNITQIPIQHYPRFDGKGNYNILRSISIWSRLATSFSIFPLRISTFLGLIISGISFILAILFIILHFWGNQAPSGWASMIVAILFFGGIQLLMLGVMGEYVGRLALYNNKKPQFVIDKIIEREQ